MTGRSHSKEPFDAIVVLGAAVGADGRPGKALRRRVAEGVRRLEAGAAPVLLLSGGKGDGVPAEAEAMRDLALAAGVSDEQLVLEAESRSTLENARCSARIMRARGWRRALVVTDAVHLPRALMAFRALGIDVKGAAAQGGARDEPVWAWPVHLAREALTFLWYGVLIAAGRHRR
jgi:uncharacterized SAM-binding protein YcdF (DUF218 family)